MVFRLMSTRNPRVKCAKYSRIADSAIKNSQGFDATRMVTRNHQLDVAVYI
eukprot:CAMPEP_0203794802 /NCGR_PEP_ID=MMETSP0100_2-20121128/6768_1 /ASSEMBLY_ACC=CAM_ASM_000210 /TAXON_ID=96639 /ORGANISM=" , Strain NY0313808BC1" /LENGTH=50 /DNA_ID=CAMNT_0050699023 /DNA_START=644 /DNA_END=796 /DNA_ORIENTATION=-